MILVTFLEKLEIFAYTNNILVKQISNYISCLLKTALQTAKTQHSIIFYRPSIYSEVA